QLHNLLQKNRIQIPHNEIPSILKKLARVDVIEVVDAKKKLFGIAVPLFSAWAAGQKTLENTVDKSPAIDLREQGTESPNALMRAVNEALALENQDNWAAAIKIYESLLEKYPKNNELRSKLHHARNQERLANRYNKALNAISCGDCEDAQKLLAEVILRDPAYKEASRFLLLATTGIDAKEMEQKLDHENEELKRARSQIVELQDKIANAKHDDADLAVRKKQVKKREQSIAKMEEKEHEKLSKLAAAKEEINQLKTAYPAKTPRKESNQTTPTQDALVTLGTLLDAKEKTEPKDVKFTRPEEIQYEDHAKPRTASTTIPASKYRHQESQKKTGSQHPKTADKTTTTEVRKEARKKHAPQDVTLNVTLATLDDLLDDPVRAQPDEKETSFLHAQTEPENENPAPAKKHEATADLPNTEEQRQSIALTDTAMIDAGQVEKLPDQPQQSEESSEESQSSYLAESQPNNHIEIAPIDENGSTSSFPDDRDDFLPENGPPKNIEIPFQPNRSQSRADFRKRVLAKKNTLKEQKRKKMQAGWIAGTLNSLPVFVWVLWLWYVQPVEWGNGGKIFVLITSVPAWLAACRFGASDKAKHITSFFALTPVVSFCFYAILTFETLRPGVPSLTNSNHELLIIAGLIYIAVIAIIAGISGQVASVVSIGTIGGAFAGAALFFNNGGAIEATLILAIITAVMLILKRVDAGSAAGAGVMAGIPAGFLLFALTFHLTAPNLNISLQAGGVSLAAYAAAAGLAYVINTVTTKMNAKSPS
ncbi:MAG: hypothetical protein ACE5I1_00095, partial [bacterium]